MTANIFDRIKMLRSGKIKIAKYNFMVQKRNEWMNRWMNESINQSINQSISK